jgi:polyferredoxin
METNSKQLNGKENYARFGRIISLITSLLTVITFGIAVCTPPLSGPFCTGSCFEYPFSDIASRFPRDYYWMYFAIILSFSYLIMMITIYQIAPENKKLFGMLGVTFAIMASLILITNYFIQVSIHWFFNSQVF